jgi:5-methylcytosine-specific restriction endonuclease McrA
MQCVVVMCEGEVVALGFCRAHYKRWRRHGVLYSPKAVAGRLAHARQQLYYQAHRERIIAAVRARRAADVEAARQREREVYRRRRAKHLAQNRARERGMKTLDRESLDYEAILRRDPCAYCGAAASQVDHIDPVVRGGENRWPNLTAACRHCNRQKSDKRLLRAMHDFSANGH